MNCLADRHGLRAEWKKVSRYFEEPKVIIAYYTYSQRIPGSKWFEVQYKELDYKMKVHDDFSFEHEPQMTITLFGKWCMTARWVSPSNSGDIASDDIYYETILSMTDFGLNIYEAVKENQWSCGNKVSNPFTEKILTDYAVSEYFSLFEQENS